MLKRFFSGFITFFPFICLSDKPIRYFPEEIYKNDWRNIGNALRKILRTKTQEDSNNDQ